MRANAKSRVLRGALAAVLACGLMMPTGAFAADEEDIETPRAIETPEHADDTEEGALASVSPAAQDESSPSDIGSAEEIARALSSLPSMVPPSNEAREADVAAAAVDWSSAAAAGDLEVLGGTAGKDWRIDGTVLSVLTPTPLTVRNRSSVPQSVTTITVSKGVHAEITLAGVNIKTSSGCPIDILTNLNGTANGKPATTGDDIVDKTTLYLKIADGTTNTLYTSDSNGAGIHCGEGSELVIDDERDNRAANGEMAVVSGAKVAQAITLRDGTTIEAGAPSSQLDSPNPGKLTVTGGLRAAGIGSTALENGGTMTFNGGDLKVDVQGAYNGESDGTSLSAGIGAGAQGDGTASVMTFNGGTIWSHGGVHGSGIGAAHAGQLGGTPRTDIISTRHTAMASNVAGDIVINGGFITSVGGEHGGAFGSACWSSNEGHTITVTGGTLIPIAGKGSTGSHTHFKPFPEIGGYGGYVVITGGSVRCTDPTQYFQGVGDTAWGNKDFSDESNKVTMVAIDLSEELRKNNAAAGIEANDLNSLIDSWQLSVGGETYTYGAPANFDNGKLYLWLPKSATEKQISVTLKYTDANGDSHEVLPLFREPGQEGDLLKRFLDFQITDPEYLASLTKYYDGTPLPAYDLSAPGHSITTPPPDNKTLDLVVDAQGRQLIRYYYQPFDRTPSDPGEGEPEATGPETSETATDGSGNTVTVLPSNAGAVRLTMVSKQYADETNADESIKEFAKSYWGHRAFMWGKIMPIVSQVSSLTAEWDEEKDLVQRPGDIAHTSDHLLKVTAVIERADTVDGLPLAEDGSNATKPTCDAPEGRVQLYVDGAAVGSPIELRFEDKKDAAGNVILGEDGQPAFPANAERRGDDISGNHTFFTYAFKPSETDHLVPKVGKEGRHVVSLKFLPPSAEQVQAGTPANYLESIDPAEDPDNAPSAPVTIEPIDPKVDLEAEGDPEADPSLPGPSATLDPNPTPDDPDADPDKAGNKTYHGTLTTTWDLPTDDNPHPGRITLNIKTDSSGPIKIVGEDGELYDADFVRDPATNEPVRNPDGSYSIVLDPKAVGESNLTVRQEPNGAYTGTTWDIAVTVKPNPKTPPDPRLTKTAENLTHPGGPTQPGDRIRYTVTAGNTAAASAWTQVLITDPVPACLEVDESSLTLNNPRSGLQNVTLRKAAAVTASDTGKFSLSEPDAEGRRTLIVPAGTVYGSATVTLTFEATVRADLDFSDGSAVNLSNVASATGKRPNPDDPVGPDVDLDPEPNPKPGEGPSPTTPPATPVGPSTVVPADPEVQTSKVVENVSAPGAKVTRSGDVLRYRITLANKGAANSCLVNAVISDPLPVGMEPVAKSIRMTLADGTEATVDDAAYDKASRTIAVTCGDLWGGNEVALVFEVTVGKEAVGADNANVAFAHGTVPSAGPDSVPTDPEPGRAAAPPTGEPTDSTPPAEPPILIGDDPAPGDVTLAKEARNTSSDDGKTRVGDVVRYTIILSNGGPATAWMDAVIRDDVPAGLEPVSGSIRMTLPDGTEIMVNDEAYNDRTRRLSVAGGHLYGGQTVALSFDALVTEEAVGADIGNVAEALGMLPSQWNPDRTFPEPGQPFDPPEGWDAFDKVNQKVESPVSYPPGTSADGGVVGSSDGDGTNDTPTTIKALRLAQTSDAAETGLLLALSAATVAAAGLIVSRRRMRREHEKYEE